MGEPPTHCIVIEDAVRGVMAGRAAGARVIGFAGGAHANPALAEDLAGAGAEVVIQSMDELPAVVRRIAA
jgi:beta-phosphoglucomutase-like phosphatase (HAD superfamily)